MNHVLFFSSRTSILRELVFYLHGLFLMIAIWLPQLRHHVLTKHPPNQKEGTRKAKTFLLMMLFVLGRKASLNMSLVRNGSRVPLKPISGKREWVYWLLGLGKGPPLPISWNLCPSTEMGLCS